LVQAEQPTTRTKSAVVDCIGKNLQYSEQICIATRHRPVEMDVVGNGDMYTWGCTMRWTSLMRDERDRREERDRKEILNRKKRKGKAERRGRN
jgi:hypothetical protein